jgi:DNA/RNA endonuclease YhcR with UshA esterase domain
MKTKIARVLFCVAAVFVAICFSAGEPPPVYTTTQAASHIGEMATVCGTVAGTHHSGRGNTFVNLDRAYPNQAFTAFIPASSASAGADLRSLEGKNICVTGKVALYKGKPEIVVTTKEQIQQK